MYVTSGLRAPSCSSSLTPNCIKVDLRFRVIFMCVNRIEAMYEKVAPKRKT